MGRAKAPEPFGTTDMFGSDAEGNIMSGPEHNPQDDQPIDREEWERAMSPAPPAGEQWVEEAAKEIALDMPMISSTQKRIERAAAIIRRHRGEK